MFKKLIYISLLTASLSLNVVANADEEILKKNDPSQIKDCHEGINRTIFTLNKGLDNIIFKPVAKVYRTLPNPIRSGVSNSLDNLSNLVTIPNNVLQGEFRKAGTNTGRFVINTTVGILGFIDVAEKVGFEEYEKEDYGQSLAVQGVGPGCYLVLPVLGPSTVRDTASSLANIIGGDAWYNVTVKNNTQHFEDSDYIVSRLSAGIDFRAKNIESFDNLEKNAVDFYASVKSLYLQDRQQKILNSNGIIEAMDDSDWDDIEN
ncbi:VacJ-like protein [alpha proteobacterium HIMB5]|nr:VacJ-like protein [alpha proteobacterium HIMB5]